MQEKATKSTYNFIFWAHLALVAAGWLGPFLFDWKWMIAGYSAILLQFFVFKKCLLNAKHGAPEDENDYTFYAELFEAMGYQPDRKRLKKAVRSWLYFVLAGVTILWQVVLGNASLIF